MMNQFSGASMPPVPPNPMYGSIPQSQSFNGYDSHNIPQGRNPPPASYMPMNSAVQNGPSAGPRHMQPYGPASAAYNQNPAASQGLPPSSVEQLPQQFSEMSMKQNLGYQPKGSHFPPLPKQPSPGPQNFTSMPPQPPYQQQPPMQSSVSGPYRLSHPPITTSYAAAVNPPGMTSPQYQNEPMKQYSGGTTGPPPPSSSYMGPAHYKNHGNVPVNSMVAPPMNDTSQNGPYYEHPSLSGGPPSLHSYTDPNSDSASRSSDIQPPQMPMQTRYPSMPPSQNVAQGMAPPQGQYLQDPNNMHQSRINAQAPHMQPAAPPANQNRRLDPDQMPSPIQVIEDDRKAHAGSFVTNTRGQVPPLVTTEFTVTDAGICSPRYMRSTIYAVPTSADILKQTSVPFALVLSPFARLHEGEQTPHISDLGEMGPVRCIRCKAYMCPLMQFIDGGRRFQCVFCKATTEVPPEYFSHLDHMGERVDKYQRPELCLGSYEFLATKEYCKNGVFPNCPAFIFAIDVSYNSIRNGMVKLLCENMLSVLSDLPSENDQPSKIKVGFITYSNVVQFYNIKNVLAQPQVMVVPDVQEMFMPLLDGFLVDFEESKPIIISLLQQIPEMFAENKETETVLGPAIQAGLEALKAADCSGKLFVFHSSLPIAEAPGKLKNRDDRKLLGTDKEKTLLTPQCPFYNNLGQECVAAGCCVDLFCFPNAYMDVATIGQVCRLTGGDLYKYTYFQSDIDGVRFLEDLRRDVSKPIAFDAIVRVRTSTGIRPTEFWGNFYMSNTTDIELAAIDCDKAIAAEIKFDDKLGEEDGAYIQAAVLFTSCSGERRLRIHNLSLNTSSQMADLFRHCELDAMMNVFTKEAIRMVMEQSPRQVKDHFISRAAQILACYRKHCANRSSVGQLILPECMKLLPLYVSCLIKSDAISAGQEVATDDRSYLMLALNSMNIESTAICLYPRLLPLHDVNLASDEMPTAIRCTFEKMKDSGVYLLENGIYMILWVGMAVDPDWIQNVFAVTSTSNIDPNLLSLIEIDTPLSKRIRGVLAQLQKERQRYMKFVVCRQGDKMELVLKQFLVEDCTSEGSVSYVDFLCHLHKEIRSILT